MADTKTTNLTAIGTLGDDDLFYVVDDPGGSPLSRKVTAATMKTYAAPAASDTVAGVIEYAVQSELEAGSSNVFAVTPGRLQYHPGVPKAWCKFTSVTTTAVTVGYNISSLTDNGAGDTTINFTTAFSSADYAIAACAFTIPGTALYMLGRENSSATATGSCRVGSRAVNPTTGALTDIAENYYAFFGDQ